MYEDIWDDDFLDDLPKVKKTSKIKQKMMGVLVALVVLMAIGLGVVLTFGGGSSGNAVNNSPTHFDGTYRLYMADEYRTEFVYYTTFNVVNGTSSTQMIDETLASVVVRYERLALVWLSPNDFVFWEVAPDEEGWVLGASYRFFEFCEEHEHYFHMGPTGTFVPFEELMRLVRVGG